MKARKLLYFISNQLEDQSLNQNLFSQIDASITLKQFATGLDLIDQLSEDGAFPDLILLDFSPATVCQLVRSLKEQLEWKSIPIVVWGKALICTQVLDIYQAGANSYIERASTTSLLQQQLESLCEYWWSVVHLPTHRAG